jgi:hypothetical protein
MANRWFPPPWSVENIGPAFVVKDGAGRSLRMSITRKNRGADPELLRSD